MKSDYTTNSRYITHTIAFWKVGRIHFLSSGVKGLSPRGFSENLANKNLTPLLILLLKNSPPPPPPPFQCPAVEQADIENTTRRQARRDLSGYGLGTTSGHSESRRRLTCSRRKKFFSDALTTTPCFCGLQRHFSLRYRLGRLVRPSPPRSMMTYHVD